jgi:hypothetical protein
VTTKFVPALRIWWYGRRIQPAGHCKHEKTIADIGTRHAGRIGQTAAPPENGREIAARL